MKNLDEMNWKDLLPDSYKGIEALKIEAAKKAPTDSVVVLPVIIDESKKNGPIKFKKTGDIDSKTLKDITEAAHNLGWGGSTKFSYFSETNTFFVLPISKVKTSKVQISRQFGIDLSKAIQGYDLDTMVFCGIEELSLMDVMEGFAMDTYDIGILQKLDEKSKLSDFSLKKLFVRGEVPSKQEIEQKKSYIKSILLCMMLQDLPANLITPMKIGAIAKEVVKGTKTTCKLYKKKDIETMGMGAYLSVAEGGVNEPCFIVLEIPGKDNTKNISLVGKGLTFDSGGISLKPSAAMDEMKYDVSGGLAVLGVAAYLSNLKTPPPVKVVCLIGATENMPCDNPSRPGDIVKAMNGKTIEVLNTDAEGRLVLADLLCFAEKKYSPSLIIDTATLTGAVVSALGHVGAAMVSNDQKAIEYVQSLYEKTGEPIWELPMWPEFEKTVKGTVGDLRNVTKAGTGAGTVTAGWFLKQFVSKSKWVHLDVAGTAWDCCATGFPSSGGCAFSLRTMAEACLNYKKL